MKNKIEDTFFIQPVIELNVRKQISCLKIKKASGPDSISNKIIKKCADIFVIPLTIIYNAVLSSATYPSKLKIAEVIALYKKGCHHDPNNYRPVSLLDCFGKILERLIYDQMMSFIKKHSILFIYQYGFRKGHSATLALIDIVDNIKSHIDNKEFGIGIFLDIRKAFDTVTHSILFQKLEHYGFRGHSLNLIKSYMTERYQYCKINNHKSKTLPINYGVPQGSVLGPLLFLLYVNDIQNCIDKKKIKLFADDTGVFMFGPSLQALIQESSNNMSKLYEWFLKNNLALSLEKTNFIIFHGKRKKIPDITEIKFGNHSIPRVKSTKYIGLILDETLSWDQHVEGVLRNIHRYFGVFYNVRDFINKDLIRTIYFSCVFSHIKYGIEIYGNCKKSLIQKLQVSQNKLLRVLSKKEYMYSSELLHKELDIFKIALFRDQFILQFVHNCVQGNPILPFKNYFCRVHENHNHNTRNNMNLVQKTVRTTTHYHGANLWNQLPRNITSIKSPFSFKMTIKSHLKQL